MLGTPAQHGMIPRAMAQLFAASAQLEAAGWAFDMKVHLRPRGIFALMHLDHTGSCATSVGRQHIRASVGMSSSAGLCSLPMT